MDINALQSYAHQIIESDRAECDYIEYKKSYLQKDKILKTICAYANNYMNRDYGYLFIGIEEQDDKENGIKAIPTRPITGLVEGQLEVAENKIKELFKYLQPKPTCHFICDQIDGRWYMVVVVEPGSCITVVTEKGAHVTGLAQGGSYIRINRDTVLPTYNQYFELQRKMSGYSFCGDFHKTATLDDLNYEYMKEYLVRIHAATDLRQLPKEKMARTLKLLGEEEYNKDKIKNFALLMFADRPEDFIPGAHVEIITESRDGTSRMSAEKFEGPIWIQAQQVRNYFVNSIERSFTLRETDSIFHRIVKNWPKVAWDELSCNMILHKNYENSNYAGIYVYPDHISFTNHNRPLPPVSITDLNEKTSFDIREYLNPQIKEMFFALHLIESYGSGIRRAKIALEENGNDAPIFYPNNDNDDYTQVIMNINKEYKEYEDRDKKPIQVNEIELPKNQRIVYDTILDNPGLRIPALSQLCGLKETSINNSIRKLKEQNLIEYQGTSRSGGYYIK